MSAQVANTSPRVLVLDADMVPALTIGRSLARRGCQVDVGSHVDRPIAGTSRHVDEVLTYPDPLERQADFIDWLRAETGARPYDLVIPVTERTLAPLSLHRTHFAHVRIAMPEASSLDVVLDKSRTLALAGELGVRIPRSRTLTSEAELVACLEEIEYPVVMKPARSIGSRNERGSYLQVSYAFDQPSLETGCRNALRYGPVVLQEYFAGDGVGVELIARNGEICYAFQHRRLHEVPLTGGGSSLRTSEPVDQVLLDASRRLIEALRWNGVAMVEFKVNPANGEHCLMEINGRFWGSLPLAAAAGADFPGMLLDLEMGAETISCAPYRDKIVCRLLSRDLMWYESVLRGAGDPRLVKLPSKAAILRELGLWLHPRHRLDVQSLSDPVPGFVDLWRIGSGYFERLFSLWEHTRFLRQQRRLWRRGDVRDRFQTAGSLLLLCYGNINRSALADAMLRGYAEDAGLAVYSAGFHPEGDRPADPMMVEVATGQGVRLTGHQSRVLDDALIASSDIIFLMEKTHYDRLTSRYPETAERTFLLGAHTGVETSATEIEDPFGGPQEAYEHCYQRVAEAVDHLKGFIALRGNF